MKVVTWLILSLIAITSIFSISCQGNKADNNLQIDSSKSALQSQLIKDAGNSELYKTEVNQMSNLLTQVEISKTGTQADRDKVVDQYNSLYGSAMGNVDNISEVADKLKRGDQYLKIKLLSIVHDMAVVKASANSKIK